MPSTDGRPDPTEPADVVDEITRFLASTVEAAGRCGVVVDVGGGRNAAVAAMLGVDALGPDRVFGLLLPAYKATAADAVTGELVANGLGIDFSKVQLLPFVHLFYELSLPGDDPPHDVDATDRAVDLLRTACLRYAAETMDRLVLGSADRTDRLLGTRSPHAVGGGDLLPLGDLFSTGVDRLADHTGLPGALWEPAAPAGSAATVGFEADAATVDAVLRDLVDGDLGIDQVSADLDVDADLVRAVAERVAAVRRARRPPATPSTERTGRYDRFHEIELRFD